jgi:hypothetical protein
MSMTAYYIAMDEAELAALGSIKDQAELEESLSQAVARDEDCLDIDASWAGIHFLLCGSMEAGAGEKPLSDLILGGAPLGEEDLGFGPARRIAKEEVAALGKALAAVDFPALRPAFETGVVGNHEVYPGYEDAEDFNYLEYNFGKLRAFLAEAAATNKSIVTFIA